MDVFLQQCGNIQLLYCAYVCDQISDAVYSLVQSQAQSQYETIVQSCEAGCPPLEASIRTDMDQIITSKEHVTSKIRGTAKFVNAVTHFWQTCSHYLPRLTHVFTACLVFETRAEKLHFMRSYKGTFRLFMKKISITASPANRVHL